MTKRPERDNEKPIQYDEFQDGEKKTIAILKDSLHTWDAIIEPTVPHLIELEQLVSGQKEAAGNKLWRDLIKLWLLGILVIGGMALLLNWNVRAFWSLQLVAAAGAILTLILFNRKNREAKRKWTS